MLSSTVHFCSALVEPKLVQHKPWHLKLGAVVPPLLDNCDVCAAARMWPYITEAGERQARAMLPDMLQQNKPTWMTTLKLDQSVSSLPATSA